MLSDKTIMLKTKNGNINMKVDDLNNLYSRKIKNGDFDIYFDIYNGKEIDINDFLPSRSIKYGAPPPPPPPPPQPPRYVRATTIYIGNRGQQGVYHG